MTDRKITAIIPCRVGSKRVKNKNFLDFCGKLLVDWTVEMAIYCHLIGKIIVTTDKEDYECSITSRYVDIILDRRPSELAQDDTPSDDVINYVREKYGVSDDIIVLLEPCVPVRSSKDLHSAIELHLETSKSVIAVNKYTLEPSGNFYVYTTENVYDGPLLLYKLKPEYNMEIDYPYQFKLAEAIKRRDVHEG